MKKQVLWRVGRRVGRTIYRDDVLVGMMDTAEDAALVVEGMNAAERVRLDQARQAEEEGTESVE